MPDAAPHPRRPPGEQRARPQQRGDQPPRPQPPPRAAGGRGVGGSAAPAPARGGNDAEAARGRGLGRGAVARREVAGAGAAGANAAAVEEGGSAGGGAVEAAISVAARKEGEGEGGMGGGRAPPPPPPARRPAKRKALSPLTAYPPPKRRAVSATRRFPAGCGRDSAAPKGGADDAALRKQPVPAARSLPKPRTVSSRPPARAGRLTSQAGPAHDGFGVPEKKAVVPGHGRTSAAAGRAMGTMVPRPRNGARQGEELEAGEADTPTRVQEPVILPSRKSQLVSAPRRADKPPKETLISGRHTQHGLFSKDKENKTERGSRVTANEIEDTDELTTSRVVQDIMPSDKRPMTQGKENAIARGFFHPKKKVKVKLPAHRSSKDASASGSKKKLDNKTSSSSEHLKVLKEVKVRDGCLEVHLNNSSIVRPMKCQWQYGVQNEDARSKVKMLCRMFECTCRVLVQAVDQRGLKNKRIDLEAADAMKSLPGFVRHGAIVGRVPGVEIGDVFLYRAQLVTVGLHRHNQAGIDMANDGNGMLIAISIVASGGYPDELSSSGELIYIGSGGRCAVKKNDRDQKLERGNLALKNCIKAKTPVRVIHGFKSQNGEGGSRWRGKQIPMYTYDGLYNVVKYWTEGEPGSSVLKYKLLRNPGQSELPLHIATRLMKSQIRQGLRRADISQGEEKTPICVINTVDVLQPAQFTYIPRMKDPSYGTQICPEGCDCTSRCSDSASCACAVKNGGAIPFNRNGAIVNAKPLIFECGPSCKCPDSCYNRVSQGGMKIPMEVFWTTQTGWGVRSLRPISSGSFICEYVGELLHGKEADERRNSDYLFNIGHNYDGAKNPRKGLATTIPGFNSSGSCSHAIEDIGFTIDAEEYGNIGRFINHSCSPNLFVQKVLWDHDDRRRPHIMFFAAETIPPLQELTYDYNSKIDHGHSMNGKTNFRRCHCGSSQCCGRLH
ncbi:hypothetical protein ACP4OV_005460 [Aristida adscensionis]